MLAASCIHNDLPYPRIQANFTSFEALGQDGAAVIDTTKMTVTLSFAEDANIYSVRVAGYTLTPGAMLVENPFGEPIDLSSPLSVTLRMYQDWQWVIMARQDIERYFEVEDQMGESVIDVPARRVVVYVRKGVDLSNIAIMRAKLGPVGSTSDPSLADGSTYDGRSPLEVRIENYGHEEVWYVYTEMVEELATTRSVDAFTCVAYVYGQGQAGQDNGVEYRIAGTEEWTRVPAADVTDLSGSITACIRHLSPQTEYEARVYSDANTGATLTFTTGSEVQLPNSDFEYWWLEKRTWWPWEEGGEPFWGTGNPGATTVGPSNTTPTTDTPSGQGYAAMLQSKYIVIRFAAGSIFTGSYIRTDGMNGVLSFGRPFTERPVRLRGQMKYECKTIDKGAKGEWAHLMGVPDTAIVWCALIDTPEPFEIRTNPANRQLLDPDGSYVVAYGKMQWGESVGSWVPFEFDINYKSTSRVPRYIVVCASGSKYGDYFVGGDGSTLYLDDIELVYDF